MSIKHLQFYDSNNSDVISAIDDLPLWSAPFGLKLLETVKLKKNLSVLDIGSGMGFPIIELSQRLGSTCKVFGIDPWKEAIDRTRMKIKTWGIKNVKIIEGIAEELPFEDEYFDLIVSNNGTNNVQDDEQIFREIERVANPGAQLVLTVNLPETMIEFYDTFKNVLKNKGMQSEIEKVDEHIFHKRKPINYTTELIEKNGFRIKSVCEYKFSFRYVDGTTLLNNFIIKLAFLESWISILREEDREPIFKLVETEMNIIAEKNGEFVLSIPWICIDAVKN